jgi:hypothetical protein
MQYVIKDLIGQMIDTLKKDSLFKGVQVARHSGEVNIFLFNNPAYWEGLIKNLPFVLIKYQGRTAVSRDSEGSEWIHELSFSTYVGTTSTKNKEKATEEAEIYLAKIFDLWHGRVFYSDQTWASSIPVLSGVKITTTEFNQMRSLMEDGGQDERLVMTLPEIVLYETKYNVRLLAHTVEYET